MTHAADASNLAQATERSAQEMHSQHYAVGIGLAAIAYGLLDVAASIREQTAAALRAVEAEDDEHYPSQPAPLPRISYAEDIHLPETDPKGM
jgi:hypothetical protein